MKKALLALALFVVMAGSAVYAATITGNITDADGNVVEGAFVSVTACDSTGNGGGGHGGGGHRGGGTPGFVNEFTVLTDANGDFLIEDAPDNVIKIRAAKRGFGGVSEDITIPEGGVLNIDLQLPGTGEEGGQRRQGTRRQLHRI